MVRKKALLPQNLFLATTKRIKFFIIIIMLQNNSLMTSWRPLYLQTIISFHRESMMPLPVVIQAKGETDIISNNRLLND